MPSNVVKSFSERSGKSVAEVEQLWHEAKKDAAKKFPSIDSHYWAYVTAEVRNKLGLKEAKLDEMVDLLRETERNEKS